MFMSASNPFVEDNVHAVVVAFEIVALQLSAVPPPPMKKFSEVASR
jgi:hypothetical protein